MNDASRLVKQYGTSGAGYTFPGSVPLDLRRSGQPAAWIIPLKTGNLVIQNDQEPTSDLAGTTPIYETLEILTAMVGQRIPGAYRAVNNTGTTANAFIVGWAR